MRGVPSAGPRWCRIGSAPADGRWHPAVFGGFLGGGKGRIECAAGGEAAGKVRGDDAARGAVSAGLDRDMLGAAHTVKLPGLRTNDTHFNKVVRGAAA